MQGLNSYEAVRFEYLNIRTCDVDINKLKFGAYAQYS